MNEELWQTMHSLSNHILIMNWVHTSHSLSYWSLHHDFKHVFKVEFCTSLIHYTHSFNKIVDFLENEQIVINKLSLLNLLKGKGCIID